MARFLKRHIEEALPEEFGAFLEILAQIRQELRERHARPPASAWQDVLDEDTLALVIDHDWDAVRQRVSGSLVGTLNDHAEIPND